MNPIRIAVVGGGPSGLTLANILQRKARELEQQGKPVPWAVTLYEAEASAESRRVSGSLDLGKNTGLAALQAAGLYNRFHDFARTEGQEIHFVNHHGKTICRYDGAATFDSDRYSPEIDRVDLNRILNESLPKDAVQWGHKLVSVQPHEKGYELVFDGDRSVVADVVIGADGAWSRVRPLVTNKTPSLNECGAMSFDIKVRDFDAKYPQFVELVGQGTMYCFGGGNVLGAQRNTDGSVHVYLGVCGPADWRQHELLKDATTDRERVMTLVTAQYTGWSEQLRELALAAVTSISDDKDGSPLVFWTHFAMPVGISWDHRPGVTLMGDAAHLMPPFAGEGVNTAMVDAMQLANEIITALGEPVNDQADALAKMDAAIANYEREMFERAAVPARLSSENLAVFFTTPELMMEHAIIVFPFLETALAQNAA